MHAAQPSAAPSPQSGAAIQPHTPSQQPPGPHQIICEEAISLLTREISSRLTAEKINRARGRDIAAGKAVEAAEHLRYAVRFFSKLRRAEKAGAR
jgi:hypothetical protein